MIKLCWDIYLGKGIKPFHSGLHHLFHHYEMKEIWTHQDSAYNWLINLSNQTRRALISVVISNLLATLTEHQRSSTEMEEPAGSITNS